MTHLKQFIKCLYLTIASNNRKLTYKLHVFFDHEKNKKTDS